MTVTTSNGCEVVLEHPLIVVAEAESLEIAGDKTPLSEPAATIKTYQIPAHTDASYNWEVTEGVLMAGAGTTNIQVQWTGDYEGNLVVTETNTQGCMIGVGDLPIQFEKQQAIPVESGWNLVSFYVQPPNLAMEAAMLTINAMLVQVKDEVGIFSPNQPPIFNSLKNVSNGQGYWVRTNQTGIIEQQGVLLKPETVCLLYTSPSPRDQRGSRMPSSA